MARSLHRDSTKALDEARARPRVELAHDVERDGLLAALGAGRVAREVPGKGDEHVEARPKGREVRRELLLRPHGRVAAEAVGEAPRERHERRRHGGQVAQRATENAVEQLREALGQADDVAFAEQPLRRQRAVERVAQLLAGLARRQAELLGALRGAVQEAAGALRVRRRRAPPAERAPHREVPELGDARRLLDVRQGRPVLFLLCLVCVWLRPASSASLDAIEARALAPWLSLQCRRSLNARRYGGPYTSTSTPSTLPRHRRDVFVRNPPARW